VRFNPGEAAEFLTQVMRRPLSVVDVATLESRTEGWITGMQLAAVSLRGHWSICTLRTLAFRTSAAWECAGMALFASLQQCQS